jgi:cellulose synthase/poly-beta-1,6-N-acetylglucosamine synthase-like glycosyltransferase
MGEMTLRWDGTAAPPDHMPPAADAPGRDPRTEDDGWIDPGGLSPDPSLVALLPPTFLLEEGLLPWRRSGAATVVLCAFPRRSIRHLPRLRTALGGPVRLARTEPAMLARALQEVAGRPLALQAEKLRPAAASCRSLPGARIAGLSWLGGLALLAYALIEPLVVMGTLAALVALVLFLSAGLRVVAAWAVLRRDRPRTSSRVVPARLPVISLLVPLYHEAEVAGTLLPRMDALDYPRDRLDLCLILENDDDLTRAALERSELPPWARVVEVPEGTLRTKPRALNYALGFARGSIIGIYDAEDVPRPDHLRVVATTFAQRWPGTACLQGALDYFNHDRNWLARCFALEYASWFRVLLPGLERLGFALPLGGTTLFLRREALEAVGGWDAHNVTEDADLGILLARHGYRTEMIPITTDEEANARPWPWVRQRSRWLKGYAMTWAVHMRHPGKLWRDLGPKRFLGFQVMFAGTILQFALAPLLWSFWMIPLGLPHPLAAVVPERLLVLLSVLFLTTQVLDLAYAWMGARRAGKERLALWAPALLLYFPLCTVALYRALWEVARDPFRWDKTAHGLDLPSQVAAPPQPVLPRLDGRAEATRPPASPRRRRDAGTALGEASARTATLEA